MGRPSPAPKDGAANPRKSIQVSRKPSAIANAGTNGISTRAPTANNTDITSNWTPVATPAGSFDAIALRQYMQVNLNDPFNFPTQCNYEIWWAPAAGAMVKETKYAAYRQRGDQNSGVEFRSQNTLVELVAWKRAGA